MTRQPLPTASSFPGGRRLPPTGGGDTVLDAMLEATFPSGNDSRTAMDRAPRIMGGGRRTAHSASPRPQRWRPVDTVRLAKSEVAQMEGQVPPYSARLRFATAPSLKDLNEGSKEPTGLHDGFYDFAAAVVRPQPSARQYAMQLSSQLEERLREVQASGASERIQGQDTRQSGTLVAAERSQSELLACMDTMETFVRDTTTDSKERDGLLQLTRKAAGDAIQKLLMLTKASCRDLDDAEENKDGLEASLSQLDADNTGLRHVMQQMLTAEGDLRSQNSNLELEVSSLKKKLEDAHENLNDLTEQLNRTLASLEEVRAEQKRGRPTTDRCVSPMMRFSAFMMSTDQVPSTNLDGQSDGVPGWVRPESMNHIGGFKPESTAHKEPRRKTVSNAQSTENTYPGSHRPSVRLSMVMPPAQQRGSRQHGSRSVNSPPESNSTGVGEQQDAVVVGHQSRSNTIVGGMSSTRESGTTNIEAMNASSINNERQDSAKSSEVESPVSEHCPEPSMLATSFPALLPFVDFHMLDPELPKTQADALALNSEHLEKHLVMLQDDYKKEVSQNEELQHSVDLCLERILVWIQAVRDSLQDISSNAIQQDVEALTTLRNAVQWLAKHPCKEWTTNSKQLEQVLQDHESELRAHLAVERPNDSEVEDLRKSIAQQRQRIQELSDQLLEARASVGGNVRPQRRNLGASASLRRTSSFNSSQSNSNEFVHHVAIQCDLSTPAFLTEAQEDGISSPSLGRCPPNMANVDNVGTLNSDNGKLSRELANTTQPPNSSESVLDAPTQSSQLGVLGNSLAPETSTLITDPADEAAGSPPAQFQGGNLPRGKAASELAAQEAKRMLLLRCPFVEAIDFTAVPASGRVLLHPPSVDVDGKNDDKLIGLKQLRTLILDIYVQKKADDARRDKIGQPRRELYVVLQEHMKRHHGVKKVVHQKSWQLVESLIAHSTSDKIVSMFSEFLDGTRDIDELSFYLYCSSVLSIGVAEESQALPPARFPEGYISFVRASSITDLLFGDLKAHPALQAELEKCAKIDGVAAQAIQSHFEVQGFNGSQADYISTITRVARCIMADSAFEVLLEGWRMSALLLDNHQSIPGFSWRRSTLAFIQADQCHRGWIDPHEVREAETRCFGLDASGILPVDDRTSFGAFIFRAVQRCSTGTNSGMVVPPAVVPGTSRPQGALEKRKAAQRKAAEAVLKVSGNAYDAVQQSLQAYLTWMMHSSELRDLAVYRSLKAHIYSFEQAAGNAKAAPGAHSIRNLFLLLLAHQFDVQYQQEDICPQHLDWELRHLLKVLRESWRRAAMREAGPEFGMKLDSLGEPPSMLSNSGSTPRMLPLASVPA